MHKQIGSIMLVAGTCIGSGMIALPMVLAKLGLIPSIGLMLIIWAIMYYTSLVNIELNLQAGYGLSLGNLGRRFSGRGAQMLGLLSLTVLSYALLAVFIYGGSSIIQKLLGSTVYLSTIASWYAVTVMLVLLLPIGFVDYVNRLLFVGLLAVVAVLIAGLTSFINWSNLPLISQGYTKLAVWRSLLPVVFTSFGFQVIFHTLTNYCDNNPKILKRAFFWGSLIPALVYIVWTSSVLSLVYNQDSSFYAQMVNGTVEVGDLVKELSTIARWPLVQVLIWTISLLAILTSVVGVGIGLCDSLKNMLKIYINYPLLRSIIASVLTVLPAYAIAIYVPNAFITVLGFVGMILAVIAILLPIYLLYTAKLTKVYYKEVKNNVLLFLSVMAGIIIICCEIGNMIC